MKEVGERLLVVIDQIRKKYPKYRRGAYFFVHESIGYAAKELKLPPETHLSAKDLLEGIRKMALDFFGPLAKEVLNYWGIFECKDLGWVVEYLVEFKVLNKEESDTLEDFLRYNFDFYDAFEKPFRSDALRENER